MTQYISKSAVIAEIERRIKEIDEIGTYLSPKGVLTNLLCHLDTLEVNEVDAIHPIDDVVSNDPISKDLEEEAENYPSIIRTISPQWESEIERAFII